MVKTLHEDIQITGGSKVLESNRRLEMSPVLIIEVGTKM